MAIHLEERPRVVYERNPLRVVVMQLHFSPIFALDQASGVAAFQEAIREEYPLAESRGQQLSFVVTAGGAAPPTSQPVWRFLAEDRKWVVAVSADFVSLETTAYERFRDFRERADRVLQLAVSTLRVSRRDRLGLRYVNEFTHPEARTVSDWKRFLKEDLLGIAGGALFRDRVTQAMQQLNVDLDMGKLVIRHGYVRQDPGSSSYLLDFDAYDDSAGAVNVEQTLERLTAFNKWIWTFFRNSITDELDQYLGPRPVDE